MKTLFRAISVFFLTILACILSISTNPVYAAANPVASYSFDEGAGTTITDASGNNNSGTLVAATWSTTGKNGKALLFNGTSARVDIQDSNSLDLTTGMTLEAWVKPSSLTSWRSVILKERSGDVSYSLYANTNNNKPYGEFASPLNQFVEAGSKVTLNTWTHLAVTMDGTQLKLYVNGTQVGSKVITGSIVTSTDKLSIGGNTVWGEYFKGLIDDVRIYNVALSATEIQTDMNTPVGTSPTVTPTPPDTQSPTVSLTAPANNATVTGATTVAANASDNIGVAGVQFKVDNANIGSEDTASPYSVSWNTTGIGNGNHTLTAVARDAAGNTTTSTSITANVQNNDTRATTGEWGSKLSFPIVAVHSTLMPDGKVIMWDAWSFPTPAKIWNPANGAFTDVTPPWSDTGLFCGGQTQLADGRLLLAGGHDTNNDGIVKSATFDFNTYTWTQMANMHNRRWYPLDATLADGKVISISGSTKGGGFADTPEIYDPAANTWTNLPISTADMHDTQYPLGFLQPNGKIYVVAATIQELRMLDPIAKTWTNLGQAPLKQGSLAMYRPGKLLYTGGEDPNNPGKSGTGAYVADTNNSTSWRAVQSMNYPRYQHNLTMLADGTVMAIGGAKTNDLGALDGSKQAELWNPDTEQWTTLPAEVDPRMYHSTSLLLPDGRVLVAGGGKFGSATDYPTAEIYSPPYLFKGTRPTISSVTSTVVQGGQITINTSDSANISKIALIRHPSVTHTQDWDQRYMELTYTKGANTLTADIPSNGNIVPPGYYMVFVLNGNGVPSVSKTIKITVSGVAPTNTPTPTPTVAPTQTPTPTPTGSITPPVGATPVAAYNFNAGTGTTLADISGNNNNGTINGATWNNSGKYGQALSFDGASNYVQVNDSPSLRLTTGMTLEAWIYPYFLSDWKSILMKQQPNNLAYALYANTYLNKPSVEIATSTNSDIQGGAQLPINAWSHVAATYDGTTLKYYVNGTLVGNKSVSGAIATSSDPLRIGGNSVWGEYFSGLIDDVRIYNAALSNAQIQSDMNTGL